MRVTQWFRRKINKVKVPAIRIVLASDRDTKVEVEWPYINPDAESNKEAAMIAKESMAIAIAKIIVAMEKGVLTSFLLQKTAEYGAYTNDRTFSVMVIDAVDAINKSQIPDQKRNNKEPMVKPRDSFDIRNIMLRHGQGNSGENNE